MFDDKQLQHLTKITVDEAQKEVDFEKIQRRLQKQPFHWQVPAVVIAMLLIVVFLAVTTTLPQAPANQAASDVHLTEILMSDGAADPKSIYFIGVSRNIEPESLAEMQELVDSLEPATAPNTFVKPSKTYRFHYSNGDSFVYQEYFYGQRTYYKNLYTRQYFVLADNNRFFYLNSSKSIVQYVLFISLLTLLLAGDWYVGRKMRIKEEKRKLPSHSHYTQSITLSAYIFVLFFTFVGGLNGNSLIHISWIYIVGVLYATIMIYIEHKHGRNHWRKLRFVIQASLLPTYLFLLTQIL